ncbi:MAG: hypothetical protein MZV70_19395, partial [Desulfobacterales bacterium]|nr:hypothetical protein [Desulfobacterales bacterium]
MPARIHFLLKRFSPSENRPSWLLGLIFRIFSVYFMPSSNFFAQIKSASLASTAMFLNLCFRPPC